MTLTIGSLIRAGRSFVSVKEGMKGVIYEVYDRGSIDPNDRQGVSIIFESGFSDGFSPVDLNIFEIIDLGQEVEALAGYEFTNVGKLGDDYRKGVFDKAFK